MEEDLFFYVSSNCTHSYSTIYVFEKITAYSLQTVDKFYDCGIIHTYSLIFAGAYLLDIKWGNRPLKVCPFKVDVHNPVYPEKVGVTGPNLKSAVIGKDLDLKIDPREAGHGMYVLIILWFLIAYLDIQCRTNRQIKLIIIIKHQVMWLRYIFFSDMYFMVNTLYKYKFQFPKAL